MIEQIATLSKYILLFMGNPVSYTFIDFCTQCSTPWSIKNVQKPWRKWLQFWSPHLILSLHYLVKCRSRSLVIYNNEFILDSQVLAQKWLTEQRQIRLATIFQKVTSVTSHSVYYSMCSKCPPSAPMPAANVDTTRKQQAKQPAFHKVM